MASSIFTLIPQDRIEDILSNLHGFTGLTILLLDQNGNILQRYGERARYCAMLRGTVFPPEQCEKLCMRSGRHAQKLGESYLFSCHANLNSIAFPLVFREELLGSVIVGPFLLGQPDSSLISELAERCHISVSLSLDLLDELQGIPVLTPAKVNRLMKILDYLLSPLLPGERAMMLEAQQKMSMQARINETIQVYKEKGPDHSLDYFNQKEKELLNKVKTGTVNEVKALLNDLIGHILFSEGSSLEIIRVRFIELTTLLSRVAIDGGARTDSVYRLNTQFIRRLYQEQILENVCMLMQEVLESFMNAMFSEADKGNPYIHKALRYIQNNYSTHLTLTQVADYVNLSPSYFSVLFSQVVGESFRDHLCRVRVEESKHLLLAGKYSLADIALSMGFPDQSYYCKVFKKFTGITPGKYRE